MPCWFLRASAQLMLVVATVILFVCLSVTCLYCVKTAANIMKPFHRLAGRSFCCVIKTVLQYCADITPSIEALSTRVVWKIAIRESHFFSHHACTRYLLTPRKPTKIAVCHISLQAFAASHSLTDPVGIEGWVGVSNHRVWLVNGVDATWVW